MTQKDTQEDALARARAYVSCQKQQRTEVLQRQRSTVERLIEAKQQVISDAQYELQLLQQDAFQVYIKCADYSELTYVLPAAYRWSCMRNVDKDDDGHKLDGRKKYPQKASFNMLTQHLQDILNIPDLKIEKITDYNLGLAWVIEFIHADRIWHLTVPNTSSISFADFQKYGKECLQLSLACNRVMSSIWFYNAGCTFQIDELVSLIPKGIKLADKEGS